jgi:hypothetical protein
MPKNRMSMRFLVEAEGERFELSRDETAPNGFRDRLEDADLQVVCSSFASTFASAQVLVVPRAEVNARRYTAQRGSGRDEAVHGQGDGCGLRLFRAPTTARLLLREATDLLGLGVDCVHLDTEAREHPRAVAG